MIRWVWMLMVLLPMMVRAQGTEDELKARLVGKPLYLRGQWLEDKLRFDGAGQLVGKSGRVTFTLAGVEIDRVQVKGDRVRLEGRRVGVEFVDDQPRRVTLLLPGASGPGVDPERMQMEIQRPASGDYGAALDAVFADSLEALVPQMPLYWRGFAKEHLVSGGGTVATSKGAPQPATASSPDTSSSVARIGGAVSAPVVAKAPEPEYNGSARALRYQGRVLLYMQVDASGKPNSFRILRPIGLGLDERALAAASQYVFKPALNQGKPTAVELNLEVSFQVF